MRDIYYKTGDGFLLVYAINDKSSMDDVRERFQSLLNSRVSSAILSFYIWCKNMIFGKVGGT